MSYEPTLLSQKVTFREWTCDVYEAEYEAGGPALVLVDANNGEEVAVATVWVEGLHPNEIAVPEYKLDGMVEALQKAKLIKKQRRLVRSGYVTIPVFKYIKHGTSK